MMDQQRWVFEITKGSGVTGGTDEEFAAFYADYPSWLWVRRAAKEPHRKTKLEDLALRLLLTNAVFHTTLLPAIRRFPEMLPYTEERQIGDIHFEAELRRICEFMVLRTDIENLAWEDQGNGTFLLKPQTIPEHLVRAQEEIQLQVRRENDLHALKLWAQHQLKSQPGNIHYAPETALTTVKSLVAAPQDYEDVFDQEEYVTTIALVIGALYNAPRKLSQWHKWSKLTLT
jgi:hypothetical protein